MIKNIYKQKTAYPNDDNRKAFRHTRELLHMINKFDGQSRASRNHSKPNIKGDWCHELLDLGETMVLNNSMKIKES